MRIWYVFPPVIPSSEVAEIFGSLFNPVHRPVTEESGMVNFILHHLGSLTQRQVLRSSRYISSVPIHSSGLNLDHRRYGSVERSG